MTDSRRQFLRKAASLAASASLPLAASPRAATAPSEPLRIQRLSWAGLRLEYRDATVFIDPWISPEIWDGAWKDPIIPVAARPGRRYVLITHLHNDHFDPAAIREIAKDSSIIVLSHESKAASVASRGFRVRGVASNEPALIGDFTVCAVPSVDGFQEFQVSWVVCVPGKRIIHCGDTLWHGGFWQIGRLFSPLDVAFLPINGAKLYAFKPFSDAEASMTPRHAVAAAVVMGAKLAVPIHYGLHDPKAYLEHPNALPEFEKYATDRAQPFRTMAPGEWLEI